MINSQRDQYMNKRLLIRYGIGDCEMIPHLSGSWVNVRDLLRLIDLITDDDSSAVMLAKLNQLKGDLS